jgi:hypothetical protein
MSVVSEFTLSFQGNQSDIEQTESKLLADAPPIISYDFPTKVLTLNLDLYQSCDRFSTALFQFVKECQVGNTSIEIQRTGSTVFI